MSAPATAAPAKPASWPMLRAMVGIGIFCALMIVLTFQGTLPIIKENQAEALERAIFQVLPGTVTAQTFRLEGGGAFTAVEGEGEEGELVYAGYNENGELTGVAAEMSANVTLRFSLRKRYAINWPRIESDEYLMAGHARVHLCSDAEIGVIFDKRWHTAKGFTDNLCYGDVMPAR